MKMFIIGMVIIFFGFLVIIFATNQKYKPEEEKEEEVVEYVFPRMSGELDLTLGGYAYDVCVKEMVKNLKESWGGNAEIYWNEKKNIAIISKDGYVSEFKKNGETIHFGFIK